MTINKQPKVEMNTAKSLPELPASQAGRRATGDAGNSAVPRARRRRFTNADKRRILQAADRCTRPGEIGALMRREGVYSSSLSKHCQQDRCGNCRSASCFHVYSLLHRMQTATVR